MLRSTLVNLLLVVLFSGGTTLLTVTPILLRAYRNESVWTKQVNGVTVYYQIAPQDEELDGRSTHNLLPCRVVLYFNPLEIDLFYKSSQHYQVAVLAHETGHCMATKVLGDARGGYQTPEQYAWAYARAHYAKCRLDASAYLPGETICSAPDPREVTPDRYPTPPVEDPGVPPEFGTPLHEWPPLERQTR